MSDRAPDHAAHEHARSHAENAIDFRKLERLASSEEPAPPFSQRALDGGSPLRIVHVLRAPVGGLFRHVLDLAGEQAARGHRVGVIADSLTGGAGAESALAALAPRLALGLCRLPIRRLPHPSDLQALAEISRRLHAWKADVVHGHGSKGGAMARLAFGPGAKAIRVYTPHGGSLHFARGTPNHRLYMAMERLLQRRTDLLLFESRFAAERYEDFIGAPHGLARIVHNGLRPEEFAPVATAEGAADLLYVGEFRLLKGLDTLLAALKRLKDEGRPLRLLLVGAGPDEASLLALAERLGVAGQFAVKPPTPAREAFALGRLLVAPSRAESLPYIVLEALAAQKPIVATKVGGVPEIFGCYADRLIASDDSAALARAIVRALDEEAGKSAQSARALEERVRAGFSLSRMADEAVAAYREALAQKA
jgi:glycosyltransferase involved in cell wall biosynthesis